MEELLQGGVAILDGGLATELEQRGADLTGHLWSAKLLVENPSLIRSTHEAYYEAGADVGISASYQASVAGFEKLGLEPAEGEKMLRRSVELLKEARDCTWERLRETGRKRPLAAASIGSYGAYLADGSEYSGQYGLSMDQLKDFHRARMAVLLSADPDILACETIPCVTEVKALLELLSEPLVASKGVDAWISVSLRDPEHLCSGEALGELLDAVEGAHPDARRSLRAIGVNCTAPRHVEGALEAMAKRSQLPLLVYANKGEEWDGANKEWIAGTATTDEEYCAMAVKWRAAGARAVGGCCRTGPDTIRMLAGALRK